MKLILARLDLTYLTACVEDSGSVSSSRTPSLAEQGSLCEVTLTTNNPDVVLFLRASLRLAPVSSLVLVPREHDGFVSDTAMVQRQISNP